MKKRHLAISMLPSILTLGNLVCGFTALSIMGGVMEFEHHDRFMLASWLIFGGMIFDVLDGRVARLANLTSEFGAQLDSLADMVTFCLAPAILSGQMVRVLVVPDNPRWAWIFSIVFTLCGALRLARYNAEQHDEAEAGLKYFVGLPSPAAAGLIASLALVFVHLLNTKNIVNAEAMRSSNYIWIVKLMPLIALSCGLLMVSRFKYIHIGNALNGKQPFMYLVALVFLLMVFVLEPTLTLLVITTIFALSGPFIWCLHYSRGTLKEEEQALL